MPSLVLGVVTVYGALGDLWISYILAASYYVKEPVLFRQPWRTLFLQYSDATPYLVGTLAALGSLLWACAASSVRLPGRLFWPLIVMLADAVLTTGCLLISGKPFWHYLILFVPPLGLLCGLAFFAGKTKLAVQGESGVKSAPKGRAQAASKPGPLRTPFGIHALVTGVFLGCGRHPISASAVFPSHDPLLFQNPPSEINAGGLRFADKPAW